MVGFRAEKGGLAKTHVEGEKPLENKNIKNIAGGEKYLYLLSARLTDRQGLSYFSSPEGMALGVVYTSNCIVAHREY